MVPLGDSDLLTVPCRVHEFPAQLVNDNNALSQLGVGEDRPRHSQGINVPGEEHGLWRNPPLRRRLQGQPAGR